MKPSVLLDTSACIPVLRNQTGLEKLLEAALHYADIRAALEATGKTIGPLDLLIAAQARSLGATLVTANAAEFQRVKGLKVQGW